MIESKKALVEQVVGGEQWLTELDTDQLRNLLLLRNAVIEEDQNDLLQPSSKSRMVGTTVARFARFYRFKSV